MKPSEEIRRIVERWMQAISERDSESTLERVSDLPGVLMIGTDPEEWFHGGGGSCDLGAPARRVGLVLRRRYRDRSLGRRNRRLGERKRRSAGVNGGVARPTYVFHLERGEWKAVQIHWSMPRGNVDLFGKELTVSLDALERAIERERPDLFATLAVDGTVTIVFTDIVDSTVLTSRLGDHAWRDVLRRHDTVIRDVTGHHGGTVVETQGDGSMLAFSSARRAVACAQVIQRDMSTAFPDDSPRSGSGSAFTRAMRSRRRTASSAPPSTMQRAWQVRRSAVRFSSRTWFESLVANSGVQFTESREVELKGLDGAHRLFAVDLTDR